MRRNRKTVAPRNAGFAAGGARLVIAAIIALIALVTYFTRTSVNPVTGEKQRVGGISVEQEVALGLQAAPQMAQQFGGLSRDQRATALVKEVGSEVVSQSSAAKSPYRFDFHLLDDDKTVNAFALPGGQVFITEALMRRFKTRGQLAAVLGHEVAHVVGRHGAEQLAKAQLTQGLTGAAVLATYDPQRPGSIGGAALAALIGKMINMRYGRADELESDALGVKFMSDAGYDPRAMASVMKILAEAGGGRSAPEFFSTHPNPENRIKRIEEAIQKQFPQGIPSNLKP